MPTLDDARSLVITPASDLTSEDLINYFHAASNSTRTVLVGSLTGHNLSSSVVVDPSGSDTERGAALRAAYETAKTLTPNGAALSASNRAQVIIPPGKYKLTGTFTLDTNFVDLVALVPVKGGNLKATDYDELLHNDVEDPLSSIDLAQFRPSPTLVYSETQGSIFIQTATDIRLHGFSIAQLGTWDAFWETSDYAANEQHMFKIGDTANVANDPSIYSMMYFWSRSIEPYVWPVSAHGDFAGTWIDCIANGWSFRCGYLGKTIAPNLEDTVEFRAKMYNCQAGAKSYVGDFYAGTTNRTVKGARFENCIAIGITDEDGIGIVNDSGYGSFSGCNLFAINIDSDSWFIDCQAGTKSFGIGCINAGNFIRCRSGASGFGATTSTVSTHAGTFIGYAEDCVAGANSFGGRTSDSDAFAASCYASGTLMRCTITGNTRPINLDGATLRSCRITTTTTGQDCLKLLDSDSSINDCELIVLQGGTGIPINAATAKNVVASHNRMNNATNDADGLGANVTNLVSSAGNVVSNSIR